MIRVEELKAELYDVVGAIYEVHKERGAGLNEACYQEGLQLQLETDNIPYNRELCFHPSYHGIQMTSLFRVDFLCKDNIVVECKSVSELGNIHRAQLFNYMRLLDKPCGILVNFMPNFAVVERYFYDSERRSILTVNGHEVRL